MTLSQLIGLLGLLITQYSCMPNKSSNDKIKGNKPADTCKTLVSVFSYPEDFARLDSINYLCEESELVQVASKKDFRIVLRFNDQNYSLFNYDFRTRLLHDKKADLLLCFKRSIDYNIFSREAVERIYILDENLMPLYAFGFLPQTRETVIEKFFYDSGAQSYFIELKDETPPKLEGLSYAEIVRLSKKIKDGNYTVTNDRGFCCESPHFRTTPYWTEN